MLISCTYNVKLIVHLHVSGNIQFAGTLERNVADGFWQYFFPQVEQITRCPHTQSTLSTIVHLYAFLI